MLPRGMHFALIYCPISEGMGVKIVNSDSGFPRGRGDIKLAVIHGRVWIFFGISHCLSKTNPLHFATAVEYRPPNSGRQSAIADLIADLLASHVGKKLPNCPFGGRKLDKMKNISNFAVYLFK